MKVNIKDLMDDAQCYDTVRELRWPEGRQCPFCDSRRVIRRGFDEKEPARQRYECKDCRKRFDDLTGTVFAGHHQSLKVWIYCCFMVSRAVDELGFDNGITDRRKKVVFHTLPLHPIDFNIKKDPWSQVDMKTGVSP